MLLATGTHPKTASKWCRIVFGLMYFKHVAIEKDTMICTWKLYLSVNTEKFFQIQGSSNLAQDNKKYMIVLLPGFPATTLFSAYVSLWASFAVLGLTLKDKTHSSNLFFCQCTPLTSSATSTVCFNTLMGTGPCKIWSKIQSVYKNEVIILQKKKNMLLTHKLHYEYAWNNNGTFLIHHKETVLLRLISMTHD